MIRIGLIMGLTGGVLFLTGCVGLIQPVPPVLPVTITIAFERVVWALPVGVEIRHPGVCNQCPVVIFTRLPEFDWPWVSSYVTTAQVYTCTGRVYTAIPVAAGTAIGVQWYLVLLEDHLVELVEMERLDAPLQHIQLFPVLP